jgi:methyl-accepting chemotaxis protein
MKWTISRRLGVGFGAMCALLLATGGISVWQAQSASKATESLAHETELVVNGSDVGVLVVRMRAAINRFMINPSPATQKNFENVVAETKTQFAEYKALAKDPELLKQIDELEKLRDEFISHTGTVIEGYTNRNDVFYNQCSPAGRGLEESALRLVENAQRAGSPRATELALLLADLNVSRLGVARTLVAIDESEFKMTEAAIPRVHGRINALLADATGAEREGLLKLQKDYETYINVGTTLKRKMLAMEDVRDSKLFAAGDAVTKKNNEMLKTLSERAKATEQSTLAALTTGKIIIATVTIAALLVGITAAIMIARSVIKPITAITNRLKDIAEGEGDLTQRVDETRGDELGTLGKWFNVFVIRIQNLMQEVSASSKQVAAASTEIAASAEEMAAGLDKQTQQTQQVSAAVEEMSASVVEVARKSSEASANAKEAGNQASTGGEVVMQTVTEMKAIASQVTESANSVNNLGTKSEQIGQIIAVINDIADQTNLLALNAAIEAARAGEHGRGFAVVADEVRKLAERTTQATEEVAKSIREIQGDTKSAVECIEAGTQKVTSGVQLATNAGRALEQIVASSQALGSMVQAIAAAAEQQSAASTQISKSVESINAVTREAAEGAQQSSKAAADLSAQAENLQKLVGRFKIQ